MAEQRSSWALTEPRLKPCAQALCQASSKEATEHLGAYKQQVRRQMDEMELRYAELEDALGALADGLKIPNPLAAPSSLSAAAA